MKVFLDANILFSAAHTTSRMGLFVEQLIRVAECVTSTYAMDEAYCNLAKAFPGRVGSLEKLCEQIMRCDERSPATGITLRPKDLPILEGAIAAGASHLLTGDFRDFGPLLGTTIQGVAIVTASMLATEIADMPD